jgi:molybdopterin synthase sulfur carrier subunit
MKINFYATFRPIIGGKTVEVPLASGATVRDLLVCVVERWPAMAEHIFEDSGEDSGAGSAAISRRVAVYVGGRNIRWLPGSEESVLAGDEVVDLFPPVAGG